MQWKYLGSVDWESQKSLEALKAVLCTNRNLITGPERQTFFSPPKPTEIEAESIGISLTELGTAVDRIIQARDAGETVVIYGDYDADGVCATALLWQVLHQLGIKVHPFIPRRDVHGYGLSQAGIETVVKKYQPSLIITVDNGIVAHQPAKYLAQQQIDLIISDHHQPDKQKVQATAVVHTDQVCGTTVAWYLARAVLETLNQANCSSIDSYLDLVAIGTIADMMPMVGVNRSYAKYGLEVLTQSPRPGIVALKSTAGLKPESEMTGYHVGFVLGPRINAMGRIGDGLDALRLLCTSSEAKAKTLAGVLDDTNKQRQDLTQEALERAIHDYQALGTVEESIIVLAGDYHEGIVGLIAGKLAEKYYKPTIVISRDGQVSKGSARSIPGVNIIELIRECQDHLVGAGGHPAAAGLSVKTEQIESFTTTLTQRAKESINPNLLHKSLQIDCQIPLELVNLELCHLVEQFAPFGLGNPQPVFASTAQVAAVKTVGQENQHLKLQLIQGGQHLEAMAFGKSDWLDQLSANSNHDFAYTIGINQWNGKVSVQVNIKSTNKLL